MRDIKELRTDFLKMYANLPLGIRNEGIAVIDGQLMSYNACWLEIKIKTKKGDETLRYLERLDLI